MIITDPAKLLPAHTPWIDFESWTPQEKLYNNRKNFHRQAIEFEIIFKEPYDKLEENVYWLDHKSSNKFLRYYQQ